jgi:RIO kinase 2
MQYIKGIQLSEIIILEEAEIFLAEILENMKIAYNNGVIHSDLSEYNVLLDDKTNIWIIDWPQYITKDHYNAEEMFERDIGNIAYYFERKHGTSMGRNEAIKYVKD